MALTMTTTSCPRFCVAIARAATLRMRSSVPTEVPPYFWTMSATVGAMGSGNSACCQSSRQTPPYETTLRRGMSPVAFYIVETFATLLGMILLAVAVLYGGRRLGIGRASGPLELLGRLPLDARRAVYLVKVGKLVYVVGSSEGGLTRIGEL